MAKLMSGLEGQVDGAVGMKKVMETKFVVKLAAGLESLVTKFMVMLHWWTFSG